MIYKCKKCGCVFEITIIGDNSKVEYLTCPKCAAGAYDVEAIKD